MKQKLLLSALVLVASSLIAADASPKDDVQDAAKQLAEKSSYSWKSTVENAGGGGGGGRGRMGPTDGKIEKDGATYLSLTRGDNTIEVVLKGGKTALKLDGGWKTLAEATADDGTGQPGPGRFIGRTVQNFKAPAAEVADLATKAKELKAADGVIAGDLTEDGAKSLLTFGSRGGNGPEVTGAKGSVKFWLKDGVPAKYEVHVEGKVSFNGNDRDVNRTTTTEIKEIGTTKVTVTDEAAKKLS